MLVKRDASVWVDLQQHLHLRLLTELTAVRVNNLRLLRVGLRNGAACN
jgi:hypothetical protein